MTEAIHVLLGKVSAAVGAVRKDGFNSGQKFNFRGIDHVVNACHPALTAHGVTVIPSLLSADYQSVAIGSQGKQGTSVRLVVEYVFTGPAGDSLTTRVASEANDSADKATAKAMSVALRTALLQTLMLPTDDADPDESYEQQQPEHVALMGRLVALCKSKEIARAEGQAQFEALGGVGELSACTDVKLLSELIDTFKGA
jgi:hypothetical protein